MKFSKLNVEAVDPVWDSMGPAGPVGPPGADGRDGADGRHGADGQDGADGLGLNLRGRWNGTSHYKPGDVITHNWESWVCREKHSNRRPSHLSKFWQLLAARGEKGERGPSGFSGQRGRQGDPGETVIVGSTAPLEITFGTVVTTGNVIYVDDSGLGQLALADSESTTVAVGFALNDAGQYLTEGQITRTDWTAVAGTASLLPGRQYFLSSTRAGEITAAPTGTPGEYVVPVGTALSADTLDIEIGAIVLLSGNTAAASGTVSTLEAIFDSAAITGSAVYVSASGHVDLAQADGVPQTDAIGFAVADVASGEMGSYATDGTVELTGLVAGDQYFLDPDTPGGITNVAPTTQYVVRVGTALTESTLEIEIEPPILLSGNVASSGTTSAEFDSSAEPGDVVYISGENRVDLALATTEPEAIGIVLTDVLFGETGCFVSDGQIELAGLTPGATYYLSADTPGGLTDMAPSSPGEHVVRIGQALSETTLLVEIEPPILLSGNLAVGDGLVTEAFTVTAAQEANQQIALSEPRTIDSVFHNGLRLGEGEDFAVLGNTVTFNCINEGDFIVVRGA